MLAPKEEAVGNELSDRFGYDTVKGRRRSGPSGFAMRATSETISEYRRALMLPQELKLLAKSKAIILATGIPPIIAEKILYFQDKAFLSRLLPAPRPDMPNGRSNALLDAEIKQLRSEVAEMRAVFRVRPLTDAAVAEPSIIPANATFDFGGIDVDLEGLTEDEMKAWALDYIDAQAITPKRRPSRKQNGQQQHERHG